MTTVVSGPRADHVVVRDVYAPQRDSHLLIDALSGYVPLTERSVADDAPVVASSASPPPAWARPVSARLTSARARSSVRGLMRTQLA